MAYTPTVWVGSAAPGISAALLNHMETQYQTALDDIPEDPAAGVAGERTLGSGALQAAPGDHGHGLSGFTSQNVEPDVSGASQGTTLTVVGEYSIPTVTTTVINDWTESGKVAAAHVLVSHCNTGGTGQLKAAIDVDGTEQISYTWAVGATAGNIHLLALMVKATADIQFEFILDNQTSLTAVVTVSSSDVDTGSSSTTTPDQLSVHGDLASV